LIAVTIRKGMQDAVGTNEVIEEATQREITSLLVSSGEWPKIQRLLSRRLTESGWDDSLRAFAQDKAREQSPLTLKNLVAAIGPFAHSSVPAEVRQEITQLIRRFLEEHVEFD